MTKLQTVNTINTTNVRRQNTPVTGYFAAPVTIFPSGERNYCLFNQYKVNFTVSQGRNALPYLKEVLQTSKDEKAIVEVLYILDRMADKKVKGLPALYPALAKFNDSKSPNIQTFLAGIYRKTQVPDAFGPLVKMLIQNSNNPNPTPANEEIGGAILEYIRNYSNNPKAVDYTA